MKIAVTYENGQVFPHFGHTETFKVYEVEGGQVVSSALLSAGGSGHEALATLLAGQGVDVLICGGIGEGARAALEAAGITLCSGASGDADEAVAAWLRGELASAGVNCDHHHHEEEEHACGEGGCGTGGCGGCAGCAPRWTVEGKNAGRRVRVHYAGTFPDGTPFDSSYDRGEPLEFLCGAGQMIHGFDAAVADMDVGETATVHLLPAEAYGEWDARAVFTVDVAAVPGAEDLAVGETVYLQNVYGQPFEARVTARDDKTVTFDANHPMAGKELCFRIELLESAEA